MSAVDPIAGCSFGRLVPFDEARLSRRERWHRRLRRQWDTVGTLYTPGQSQRMADDMRAAMGVREAPPPDDATPGLWAFRRWGE